MNSYNIEGDDTLINVSGTLGDTGRVTIMKNEDEYVYDKSDGKYSENIFPRLHCNDGAFIDEGPTKQEIRLPDGTVIEKGVITHKATLPNGDVIKSKETEQQSQKANVSIQSDSSSNVDITVSVSSTEININNKSKKEDEQNDSEETHESKLDILSNFLPSPTLALFIFLSLIFSLNIILYICTFVYAYQVGSNLMWYFERYKNNRDSSEKEEMGELEKIKNEYTNNNISEDAFESKLEDYFENSEKDYNLQYN